MNMRRLLVALLTAVVVLSSSVAPASAEPKNQKVVLADESGAAASNSTSPQVAASEDGVQAAHVHPPESKPEVLKLLVWLKSQLPTLEPMLNKVLHDFDPVSAAMWEKMDPFLQWFRGELTTVLPMLFNMLCIVGDDAIPSWACNFLINTIPGLLEAFWPIVVAVLPFVLGLIGKFFEPILDLLIILVDGDPSAVSTGIIGASSEVTAAHLHPELLSPYVQEFLRWLADKLPTIIDLLLPVLYEARSVIAQAVADSAPIFVWLVAQLPIIVPPSAKLTCIVADDIPGLPLLCLGFDLIRPVVEDVFRTIIDAVQFWVNQLPFHAGTTTAVVAAAAHTTATATSADRR